MDHTAASVLRFVEENDVKFIRLAFCDMQGRLRNLAILPGELGRAFETGVPFDAASIPGFAAPGSTELFLFPDAATLSVLPWRPQQGRVMRLFCFLYTAHGEPFYADGRRLLQRTVRRLEEKGLQCRMGTRCEFYLFRQDGQGRPTKEPQDAAGYLDVAPLDRGENVRREICLALEDMDLRPASSHHERGPGQNEIDFRHAPPLTAADDVITFKQVVSTVAANQGLCASFDPKPLEHAPGSAMQVSLAVTQEGQSIFAPGHALGEAFCAGLRAHLGALCAFTNPLDASYARLAAGEGRDEPLRLPAARACVEVRTPDAACGPYYAFALLLAAGLDGMQKAGALPGAAALPRTRAEAAACARASRLVCETLGTPLLEAYLAGQAEV